MKKPRIGSAKFVTKKKPKDESLKKSSEKSEKKEFKLLRYKLEKKEEVIRLTQLTRMMCQMKILDEQLPGVASKILMEIMLTQDLITVEVLQEYRNRKTNGK